MTIEEESVALHENLRGKIETGLKIHLSTRKDLSMAYTPGVAEPCRRIAKDKSLVYSYTNVGNTVAIITDGTAVLGLGDIGPEAGLPVMEGKALLFKEFGNVDAFPIALSTKDVDEIIEAIVAISPSFGGINLEDISAPRCFIIEEELKKRLSIPVFHDDQHGTAIVVLAALMNSLKLVDKQPLSLTVVISGAGAAGIAIANILLNYGVKHIILLDSKGAIYEGREDLNDIKKKMAKKTNHEKRKGFLRDVIVGADVFIGVSQPNVMTSVDVKRMNEKAIVFAMSNPIPEIDPVEAKKGGAFIIGTGRSDYPNQINNVLAFPGVFRGTFDCRAKAITEGMKVAAAKALALYVKDPSPEMIIPDPLDRNVALVVAEAVRKAAVKDGVAEKPALS